MTVQTIPFALQNAAHSAAVFRQAVSAPFYQGGIITVGELQVAAQSTPNMSIVLGPGRAKVPGSNVSSPMGTSNGFTTQAMYDVLNDANVTLTIAAADPTNPRIDIAYVGVQDSYYSGSNNQAIAGVVTGTPAATPTAPAVPSNSIAIASIAVAANTTSIAASNISSAAQSSPAILNGVVPVEYVAGGTAVPQNGTVTKFPPAGTQLIQQIQYVSVGTNSSGAAASAINFPYPFPNACLSVQIMTVTGSGQSPVINAGQINRSSFTPIWNSSPNVTVNFTAWSLGW